MMKVLVSVAFLLPPAWAQFAQQGSKLVGTGAIGPAQQGSSVALSADGNTAIVGGPKDNGGIGATWVYSHVNGAWIQAAKLVGTGSVETPQQGASVALSADGSTALVGGPFDQNRISFTQQPGGAMWVFVRSQGTWAQQAKLVPTDSSVQFYAEAGWPVALSADGDTAAGCSYASDYSNGAVWVFTRANAIWTQQAKLATGSIDGSCASLGISGDGNTVIAGGSFSNAQTFTRLGVTWSGPSQLKTATASLSSAVAISGDGNTAIVGGTSVFTRTNGVWTQQATLSINEIGGSPFVASSALSTDGNVALLGGPTPYIAPASKPAAWTFVRTNGVWSQQLTKIIGADDNGSPFSGSAALSGDGNAAMLGDPSDTNFTGAAWIFARTPTPVFNPNVVGFNQTFTFTDPKGVADIGVVNVLINNVLDGRKACYLAYSRPLNLLYLVGDDGGTLSPEAFAGSAGSLGNGQCTVTWTAGAVSTNGNNLSLALNFTATSAFEGPKVVYAAAGDVYGNNSGWQPIGIWPLPPTGAAQIATAMYPPVSAGLGPAAFTFTFTDTKGFSDLGVANILINSSIDGRQACYLAFSRPANALYLVNDRGDALSQGASLSGSGSVGNSQCTVSWGAAAMTPGINTLNLNLNLAFSPMVIGNRIIYLAARDTAEQNNTGWQPAGVRVIQ